MRLKLLIPAILSVFFLSSCTPAFSVRLYNRSDHDITVQWKDTNPVVLKKEKNKLIGGAYNRAQKNTAWIITNDTALAYKTPDLYTISPYCIKGTFRYECLLEFTPDYKIYALNAKTLERLDPQPNGFPISPSETKMPAE